MGKTPRGWLQIGESRTRGVARIPLRLKPSRDSRATSQRDSPIWIQPLGVSRYITSYRMSRHKCVDITPHFSDYLYAHGSIRPSSSSLILERALMCLHCPNTNTRLGCHLTVESMKKYTNFLVTTVSADCTFNTLRPRQDGRHFPDDTFKWIFLNENV